ncbi:MAG: hypothetical protein KDA99_25395, partial [Planctomycetales bacterium]|nr:hypothetical protein [Planctomycetales bacterium]
MTLEPLIGRDLFVNALGLSSSDANAMRKLDEELLEHQTRLSSLQQHYGPAHPEIRELLEIIRGAQVYRARYQDELQRRANGMRDPKIGAMLVQMAEEDLVRTWKQETELQKQFEDAQQAAQELNVRLANVVRLERNVEVKRNL